VFTFKGLAAKAGKFETAFWSGEALEKLYNRIQSKPGDPWAAPFARDERVEADGRERADIDGSFARGLQQRIDRAMGTSIQRE